VPEQILCDEELRVSLETSGQQVLLTISDGVPTSFVTDATLLEETLKGSPLQLSSSEGYCRIEAESDGVRLDYALKGGGRKTCFIPVREFEHALSWARDLGHHS
jgi:hypothetical protein